jgi:hypothetical protein
MDKWKMLLIGAGLVLVGFVAFPLLIFVYNAFWWLFWIALIGAGGYAGWRFLHGRNRSRGALNGAGDDMLGYTDSFERELQEIRRKYQLK